MDAIRLLKQQHRKVEELFERFDNEENDQAKLSLFEEIADSLAIHATIEERHFYPAVRAQKTEDDVEEAYDEHLEVKKLLVDAMGSTEEPGFDGKVAALKGAVEHHVEEEEEELFPRAQKVVTPEGMEAIGQQMEAEAEAMKSTGGARKSVKVEVEPPAAHA